MIKTLRKIACNARNRIICSIKVEKGNELILGNATMKYCEISIMGRNNIVEFGENCNFRGLNILVIGNNNRIKIGKNTIINASKKQPTVINAVHGSSIILGDNCLLSNNIEIHSSDYHKILDVNGMQTNPARDIIIGNHVWIGLRTIILKGTVLKDNIVIGAGSLISSKYEVNNCIIAGNPSKVIKNDIDWDY